MNERVTVELAGLDLSELLSQAVRRHLPLQSPSESEQAARRWYEENKAAVDAYNQMIEAHGLFSDGVRMF